MSEESNTFVFLIMTNLTDNNENFLEVERSTIMIDYCLFVNKTNSFPPRLRRIAPCLPGSYCSKHWWRNLLLQRLKENGVRVSIVALGSEPNYDVINQVASKPILRNVFTLENIEGLISAIKSESNEPCRRGMMW